MWKSTKTQTEPSKTLEWNDFHQDSDSPEPAMVRVASQLRSILEKYEESEFIKYLVAPSPDALSGFFLCEVSDIYSALQDLHRQGYEYELTNGDSSPIVLWDPLVRQKVSHAGELEL